MPDSRQQRIEDAVSAFPEVFGLRGFPGKKFTLSVRASYIASDGTVMLYTLTEEGLPFAKGTVAELTREVVAARP